MTDSVFLDTNILIYAYSIDQQIKRDIVNKILQSHSTIIISTQVINEFINVMTKKKVADYHKISIMINDFSENFLVKNINLSNIKMAIDLANKYKYSYFDCLILSSAISSDCRTLYSEDMHHHQVVEGDLKIINPFK